MNNKNTTPPKPILKMSFQEYQAYLSSLSILEAKAVMQAYNEIMINREIKRMVNEELLPSIKDFAQSPFCKSLYGF